MCDYAHIRQTVRVRLTERKGVRFLYGKAENSDTTTLSSADVCDLAGGRMLVSHHYIGAVLHDGSTVDGRFV